MKVYLIEGRYVYKLFIRLLWILLLIVSVEYASKTAMATYSLPINGAVIVIDAGHGGRDPGASGATGVTEEEINLKVALKLRRLIEQGGGLAIMTREDHSGLYTEGEGRTGTRKSEDLNNRHQLINESSADLFISIHLNSFPQSQYYGAQTFYQTGDEKGRRLADLIQAELIKVLNRGNDRVTKPTDSVYILKNNTIPGALVECGFLSNYEEEQLLREDHYQEKIAWSIFCGIIRYLEEARRG